MARLRVNSTELGYPAHIVAGALAAANHAALLHNDAEPFATACHEWLEVAPR